MKNNKTSLYLRISAAACIVLLVLQVLLVPISWVLSALYPGLGIHSLLSGEGLRWAFRTLASSETMPHLPSLILLIVAIGLAASVGTRRHPLLRGWLGRGSRFFLIIFAILILICLLLLLLRGGMGRGMMGLLLSPTGHFPHSSLAQGIVPLCALVIASFSLIYGFAVGIWSHPYEAIGAAVRSIAKAAPLILLYILAAQLYAMLRFIVHSL